MKTPIVDFVKDYVNQDYLRLHMPGHKGKDTFGFEKFDITEIPIMSGLYFCSVVSAFSDVKND